MTDDIDVKLDLFEQLYISVLNEHALIVGRRVKTIKQPPWFNTDLARLIMARDRLFDCTKHSNDPRASAMYKTAKNHVNYEIQKAKRDFYIKSLEQHKPNLRMIWNHIKSSLATTSTVQPRQTNSQLHPHANVMVDKFNEHFANVALKFNTTTTTVPNYLKLWNLT